MKAVSIIGGRPNIIKAEPVYRGLIRAGIQHEIIDIGVFQKSYGQKIYTELDLPKPATILQIPSTEDYLETIKLLALEINKAVDFIKPDVLLIYGDINPGVAASLSSLVKHIPFVHVEAGLRNYELNDTEEINRLIIDRFSRFSLCTSNATKNNLIKENFDQNDVFVVGNTIIDALKRHLKFANTNILKEFGLLNKKYGLLTIHREENLTSPGRLDNIFKSLEEIQKEVPLVFIKYKSTTKALTRNNQIDFTSLKNLKIIHTLSYHDYIGVLQNASFIITDSSGIQDEATFLGIPCITCRETTHRIDTLQYGNNHIVSDNWEKIILEVKKALSSEKINISYPAEWDIDVGSSIASVLIDHKEILHG